MTTPSDDLLIRLRRGEDTARRELFGLCQARLRPFFHSRLPNPGDVDDCVSEVVARALEGIRRGHHPNVLDAWLFGIARNLLKERYEARRRDGGELPADWPRPAPDPRVELDDTADLPEVPTELEMLIGKRQLWAVVTDAIDGIGAGLQPVMRAHVRLSREEQRFVVGQDLAEALDMPVTGLNRQLDRARKAMLNSIAALVVARTCGRHCPDLSAQLDTGRGVVLDPAQSARVLKHAAGCAVCGPRARDAREYSKWALGPGLIGLAQDDDEHRRAVIALFCRGGDGAASSGPAGMLGAVPLAERVRVAVTTRVASIPGVDNVLQFVQQDPDAARRVVAVVVGSVVLAATIMLGLLGDQPGSNRADAEERAPVVDAMSTTSPALPSAAAPPTTSGTTPVTTSIATSASTSVTTSAAPSPRHPSPTVAPAVATTTTATTTPPVTTTDTTSNPPPRARDITIDATAAAYVSFGISGQGTWKDARSAQPYRLDPGPYLLLTTPGYRIPFTVTTSWTVDYDHRFDHVVAGRDSSTLVVRGLPVTFDTSGTDYANTAVNGTGWSDARKVRTMNLLPGPHFIQAANGSVVRFQIADDGTVRFDQALDTMLTGRNTTTLTVRGLPVTVDTSGTDYANTAVSGTGWRPDGAVRVLRLFPGPHYVQAPTGGVVRFQVTDAGRVEFDHAVDHLADGRGSATLVIRGLPVTFDTSGTDYTNTAISGTGWRNAGPVRTLRLLPGPHYVQAPTGGVVRFQVTDAGLVEFDHAIDHLAKGRGTPTLTIEGLPVTIDRSAVDYTYLAISGVGPRSATATLRLLPGAHHAQTPLLYAVRFQVTSDGQVEFDRMYDRWALGRGTQTLTVRSVAITVDATATTHTGIQVSGVAGWRDPRQEQTVRLLPGKHRVVALDGRAYDFVVKDNGLIDYDPSLDSVLSGRNTTTLTIR